jgi:DNA-binding transcriptional ArsR family regulator
MFSATVGYGNSQKLSIGDRLVTYSGLVDAVFKALADPTRRDLLDELFKEDGQTLHALEAHFAMTRYGVMKHLKLLEEAGLGVTAVGAGRNSIS